MAINSWAPKHYTICDCHYKTEGIHLQLQQFPLIWFGAFSQDFWNLAAWDLLPFSQKSISEVQH